MVETRNRNGVTAQKPNIVRDYNTHMSGIDLSDQMMSYYSSLRKTIRWYKKLAIHILTMGLHNAHILPNRQATKKLRFLEFREAIIKDLLKGVNLEQIGVPHGNQQHGNFHYLMPHDGKGKMKNCVQCNKNHQRRTTRYMCPVCPANLKTGAHPSLCVFPCFKDFHTQMGLDVAAEDQDADDDDEEEDDEMDD